MNPDALLETRRLCKTFRTGSKIEVRAVVDVSLTIAAGSFTVLTGPSGSGKTTLLALSAALERPSGGQVLFQGRDLSVCSDVELARVRRRFGFVFQDFSLLPQLPVWENITYPLIPRGVNGRDRWTIAQQTLARLGMPEKILMRLRELSGGEQQRVALARAFAGQPELILADEPISNLDPASGHAVLDQLREFHAAGKTVILSTHDPSVLSLATNVVAMQAGQLTTTASPETPPP